MHDYKSALIKAVKQNGDPFLYFPYDEKEHFSNPVEKRKFVNRLVLALIERLRIRLNKDLKIIHVIGTSGKGSTAMLLAQLLKQAGFKAGAYVKPHLKKVNERFAVSYKPLPSTDKLIRLYLKLLNALAPGEWLTYPARTFVTALLYFSQLNLDYLIVEAGIGAEYDYTDVFREHDEYYNVITNVGNLHKENLGQTLKERFYHKLSLVPFTKRSFLLFDYKTIDREFRPPVNLVLIKSKGIQFRSDILGSEVICSGKRIFTNLFTHVHLETLCKLLRVLEYLGIRDFPAERLIFSLPARVQPLGINRKAIVLDTSHGVDQILRLFQTLNMFAKYKKNINFLIATTNYKILQLFEEINNIAKLNKEFRHVSITWADSEYLGPYKNLGYEYAKSDSEKNDSGPLDKKLTEGLNVFTGSVYYAGLIAESLKIKTNFLSNKSVNYTIDQHKRFGRLLIKTKLRNFSNTKDYITESEEISDTIEDFLKVKHFSKVALFVPLKELEPKIRVCSILRLLNKSNAQVYLPFKIKNTWHIGMLKSSYLDLCKHHGENVGAEAFNLPESYFAGQYATFRGAGFQKNDLIFLPGLAFDKLGHRLGHGGGVYDRFLEGLDYTFIPWFKLGDYFKLETPQSLEKPLVVAIAFRWQFLPYIVDFW